MFRFIGTIGVMALVAVSAFAAAPGKKEIKPSKQWKGSVEDEALKKDGPALITDAKTLEKVWKSWKVAGKVPEVDFAKEIVLTSTTSGSLLNLTPMLDDKGDLQIIGMATADFRPGFRYVIIRISREGVKSVDGKKL